MVSLLVLACALAYAAASNPLMPDDYTCTDESKTPVQNIIPVSNGCSKPPGMSVEGEEDFTYCCDRHDSCYQTCGIAKKFCEDDFGRCMSAMCSTTFASNSRCHQAAQMYKLGVSMFGGAPFQNMQSQVCDCVDDADVAEKWLRQYREIYKSSGKTEEEQEEALEKQREKMEALSGEELSKHARETFYKLLKKYDAAIRHEGNRVGRMKIPKPVKKDRKSKKQKTRKKTSSEEL